MGRYTEKFKIEDKAVVPERQKTETILPADPSSDKYFCQDPRAEDLPEDTEAWSILLHLAWQQDQELCSILHGFRGSGTRLKFEWVPEKKRREWRLRPDIDPTGDTAWRSVDEYRAQAKKWLEPYRKQIVDLLDWLGGVVVDRGDCRGPTKIVRG